MQRLLQARLLVLALALLAASARAARAGQGGAGAAGIDIESAEGKDAIVAAAVSKR